MFNQVFKDKRKLFFTVICGIILLFGLYYMYQYFSNEGLTDNALINKTNEKPVNMVTSDNVVPAYTMKSTSSNVLPIQSISSVGPSTMGEPIEEDVKESFQGGGEADSAPSITKYIF